jgi:hypothetical protein
MSLLPIFALLSVLARADDAPAPAAPASAAANVAPAPADAGAPTAAGDDFALRPEETVTVKGTHGRAEFAVEIEQDGSWLPVRGARVAMDGASWLACPNGERVSAVVTFAAEDFAFVPAGMRSADASADCGSRVVLRFTAANRQTRFLRAWLAAYESKARLNSSPAPAAWPKDIRFLVGDVAADAPRAKRDVLVGPDSTTTAIESAISSVLADAGARAAAP